MMILFFRPFSVEDYIEVSGQEGTVTAIGIFHTALRTYDNRVSYSTVRISLNEVIEYTPAASPTFAERVSRSFKSSWKSFASFWQDFAVWIVSLLPVIITLSVIAGAVVIIVVSATKKKNKK